jgi:hippurate hydrolase
MSIPNDLDAAMTAWRRHLHANPEPSLHEKDTAAFVAARLAELGIPHVTAVGGHGVVATLHRPGSDRSVGLRADMDALPIEEATGAPWASTRKGVMHACGHDGHTAALLGAAALLIADPGWTGTIRFVFQPAEEGFGGARAMLADGLFRRFPMERIFGWHNWPGLPAGTVQVHPGPVMAGGARIEITLDGQAVHAAMPHLGRDPMLAAGHLLIALQSVVSRVVDPLDAAVVSITMIEGGTAWNQIPRRAVLRGTMRHHRPAVADAMEREVRRIADGVGSAYGMAVTTDVRRGAAITANHEEEAALAFAAALAVGQPARRDLPPSMAGEDFGWYLMERPGAFAWIGNGEGGPGRELHDPAYDFNDAVLPVAARWLAETARRALA